MRADPTVADFYADSPWTLAEPLSFTGVGVHSGQAATVRLEPAPAGHGLVFYRTDLPGVPAVPARFDLVSETTLSTTLSLGDACARTVEHLLAALWGLGVTDARIELDGPEVPILDGSALPYVEAIGGTGVRVLEGERAWTHLPPVGLERGDKALAVLASDSCRISYSVDYGHPFAGPQLFQAVLSPRLFAREIAPARTFGFARDVEAMRAAGLAKGGSLENAIVIGDEGPSSPLRFPDELVRHKVLDLIGDWALLGVQWRAHVLAFKAGHQLHNELARALSARGFGSERSAFVPFAPTHEVMP